MFAVIEKQNLILDVWWLCPWSLQPPFLSIALQDVALHNFLLAAQHAVQKNKCA